MKDIFSCSHVPKADYLLCKTLPDKNTEKELVAITAGQVSII